MGNMNHQNLQNIKDIFEKNTGVDLSLGRSAPWGIRRTAVLAVVIGVFLTMAAFTYPLFSPLDGDALSLTGTYLGNGLVSVYVENGSEKDLVFQEQLKLVNWFTELEAPRLEGTPEFSGTRIEAGTSGTMTIDLSGAYDTKALEQEQNAWYYLVLTNQNFLFGHDWMCSVEFAEAEAEPPREDAGVTEHIPADNLGAVEGELRFYFEKAYGGVPLSFNEANFAYQQKVEEMLARFDGTVVSALSPDIMVMGPSVFLDPEPAFKRIPDDVVFDEDVPAEEQYRLTIDDWTYSDGYGRMVASYDEKAWVHCAMLPQRQGETDGGVALPLVFWFVYSAEAAQPENYAFIYGQLYSFSELEAGKIYADEHYAIYDATSLIYTDLDAYLDYFVTTRTDVYCDEAIRQRVRNIYDFFQDTETVADMICYRELP